MLAYVKDGQQQDAEEFLRLFLDAIDEELSALLASVSGRQSASATLEVDEREVSQSGQTEVGKEAFRVRQLFQISALNLALIKNARHE